MTRLIISLTIRLMEFLSTMMTPARRGRERGAF
jgi:hypothetical protein